MHTLDIAPLRSELPPQKRSGMARVNGTLLYQRFLLIKIVAKILKQLKTHFYVNQKT